MKKQFLTSIFALSILATSANANEDNDKGVYFGINYNYLGVNFDDDLSNYYADSYNAVNPYIGYDINKHLAIEAGFYLSDSKEKTSFSGLVNTSTSFSGVNIDAVGKLPVNDNFKLLGSVGYTYTEASISAIVTGSESLNTLSSAHGYRVGVGAQYNLYKGVFVRGMGYYVDPGFSGIKNASIASIGMGYKF